jgi:hypothetical protein
MSASERQTAGNAAGRLKHYWRRIGVKIRPGVSHQDIESFEKRYGVPLTPDVRDYFACVDGMDEGDSDNLPAEWYSLQRVRTVREEVGEFGAIPDYRRVVDILPEPDHCFVFMDYLIFSHVYAFRLFHARRMTSPVIWISGAVGERGPEYRVMSDSLADFLETYVRSPEEVPFPRNL